MRVNEQIRAKRIRLIDSDGEQLGVVDVEEALKRAEVAELDLVEISPQSDPPVCRVMDYGKFVFQQSKKKAAAKKKQKQSQVKELKYRPGIEEGDYQVKLRKLVEFLEHGDKVKITMRFRGREVTHNELGYQLLERLQTDLDDHGAIEQIPRFEGRQLVMIVGPRKK